MRAAAYRQATGQVNGLPVKAAPASAVPVAATGGPPYDPEPRRADVEHQPGCRCEQAAVSMGAWPSRCW